MKKWIYSNPTFECDKLNYDLLNYAPWSGHRNFAYDFINYFRPNMLVELGSHYGCSAFAFSQAVKDFELDTKLCFVDTWQGDDFTKKYDNDVYTIFSRTVKEFYEKQNINMIRMTFDEANNSFEDGTIDVLHIDGSHHYDDVKRDFQNWLPKVSKKGIILLHDISCDIVLGDIMGSYKFWLELQKKYKYTVSFDFSWGLGIIFLDPKMYDDFIEKVDLTKYQRKNNALDVEYKDQLRKNHFELKDKQMYIDDLLEQRSILNTHLENYKLNVAEKENYINKLANESENRHNDTVTAYENEKKNIISDYEKDKAEIVAGYEENLKNIVSEYENNLKNTVDEYESDKNDMITSYESTIKEAAQSYENTIKETRESYEFTINDMASKFEERILETQNSYEATINGKDAYIEELEKSNNEFLMYNSELENIKEELIKKVEQLEQALKHPIKYRFNQLKNKE